MNSYKIKALKLKLIMDLISDLKTDNVSIPEIKSLLSLRRELQGHMVQIGEMQNLVFTSYDIKMSENGNYSWIGHEKEKEITAKSSEILNSEIVISNTNFLSDESFFSAVTGKPLQDIDYLESILKVLPPQE